MIIDGQGIAKLEIPYEPRDWQRKAEGIMNRFTVLVMHRRAGKTVFDVYQSIMAILECPHNRPRAAYIGVTLNQTRETAWDYYKEYLRPFNRLIKNKDGSYEELVKFNSSLLTVNFSERIVKGGGRVSLYSYEKPDSILGAYLDHVVMDEFQVAPQRMFGQIIRPMLADRKGSCIITGTPRGKNQFFDFNERGLGDMKGWTSILMDYKKTNEMEFKANGGYVLGPEEVESMRDEMTQEEFEQEMECSFEAAIKGSFFGKNLRMMRAEDRIADRVYDSASLVGVAVDIGLDGYGIWYFQKIKGQVILIDADIFFDKDTRDIIPILQKKPYHYSYILVPHDGDDKNASDKFITPRRIFKQAGFRVHKQKRSKLDTSIRMTRKVLDNCLMTKICSEKKVKIYNKKIAVIDALSLYSAKYDKERDIYKGATDSEEDHDQYSHLGAALRTLGAYIKLEKNDNIVNPAQAGGTKARNIVVNNTYDPLSLWT